MALFFNKNNNLNSDNSINSFQQPKATSPLKIIALSGSFSATKNMTLYEYEDDIIVVDCGIGFPEQSMHGVDLIIPDMTYLVQNISKIKAIFITHSHEDHMGAISYFLEEFDVPIYSNRLVQEYTKEKLKDRKLNDILKNVKFKTFVPEDAPVVIGPFKISGFRINHSVPSSFAYVIDTPQGRVVHAADYKFDPDPVLDKPADVRVIKKIGEEGVLCMLSDCLGCSVDGGSDPESILAPTFDKLFSTSDGRQLFITVISSNIARMHQIFESAIKHKRKIVLSGRSMEQTVRIGIDLGYLPFEKEHFVPERESHKHLQASLVYIISGCFGQVGSSLDRLSRGEHDEIVLEKNALVVFSAEPNPPGVDVAVLAMMDRLVMEGAEIYAQFLHSRIHEHLHISGHGHRDDLKLMASLLKPKYIIPIGDTVVKMRVYKEMLQDELGYSPSKVFELMDGQSVVFDNESAKKGPTIETQEIFINSNNYQTIPSMVVNDRNRLSTDGIFVVTVVLDKDRIPVRGKVDIVTRGLVISSESKAFLGKSKDLVNKIFDKNSERLHEWGYLKNKIEKEMERFVFKEVGKSPIILVISINL
jgi:ribonuclease J